MTGGMISETAPAKINLYLHVGPRRADGLHDLASLFVFTEEGDRVFAEPAADLSLTIEGPFAAALAGADPHENLVMAAARALQSRAGCNKGAKLRLEKNLPVAAGVGGGSADAAAALRALVRLWGVSIADADLRALAFNLGADIPACLERTPRLVEGAGEILLAGPHLPPLTALIVNPGVAMPTGPVFRAFDAAHPSPPPPIHPPTSLNRAHDVSALMASSRNDLEPAARSLAPDALGAVLDFLSGAQGGLGARMSGSGATCFALFERADNARAAEAAAAEKGWWTLVSPLASG